MRPVTTILDRFRRAAAVPAEVGDEVRAELAPVFAELEELERDGERIRAEARATAAARLTAARTEAARVRERGAREAEAARARAAAEAGEAAERTARQEGTEAEREAERIRQVAGERMDELVATVVACVKESA